MKTNTTEEDKIKEIMDRCAPDHPIDIYPRERIAKAMKEYAKWYHEAKIDANASLTTENTK